MSIAANLIERYNTSLMANADVRALVSSVDQDAQSETIDMEASASSVRAKVPQLENVSQARREIIGWLNGVFFSVTEMDLFWWEMHTRIQKLLTVAMILEGDNLRSFGTPEKPVVPTAMDIPQCLVGLHLLIASLKKEKFPELEKSYAQSFKMSDPLYISLYTKEPTK